MNDDKKCGLQGGEIIWTLEEVQYTEKKRLIATLYLYCLSCSLAFSLQKFCDDFSLKKLT